jgi:hypothetical protein
MACQAEVDPNEKSQKMTLIAEADACERMMSFSAGVERMGRMSSQLAIHGQ